MQIFKNVLYQERSLLISLQSIILFINIETCNILYFQLFLKSFYENVLQEIILSPVKVHS
jgi:hypothetical protein